MKSSAKSINLTSLDDLFSTEESRAEESCEKVVRIPLAELHPFPNHPFHVRDDEAMQNTVDSIKEYGVLTPGIVRPREDGGYEIVAGHRRKHGSELAGLTDMPCIVREMDNDNSLKDVREASKAVIDTFGFDRTMFVLANTIRIKNYDGRISPENKTWAQTIPICEDQLNILVDRCNPGLLDLFTNQVRKDFAAEQQRSQQKVSVREKLHGTPARAAERSASSKRDRDAR